LSNSNIVLAAMLTALGLYFPADAWAASPPMKCVNVQVNEGETPPSVHMLQAILPKGGCVRDMLGWHQVEQVAGQLVMPAGQWQSYQNVAAAGGYNIVTLGFGNALYGSNGYQAEVDNFGLPVTMQQIQAFKKYAVWVVSNDGGASPDSAAANIPNLYGVSIWNELNGSWTGGISNIATREEIYAKLINVVGPAIRAANPDVKVIVGATVGSNTGGWYLHLFADHMWGKNDPGIYLDVHPYLGQALTPANQNVPQLAIWNRSMKRIRGAGINNALFATEWGGWIGNLVETKNPGVNYFDWMQANLFGKENFAGTAWFEATNFGNFGNPGLIAGAGGSPAPQTPSGPAQTTRLGSEFVAW
jgi:hypothetical protein